ncbi:hypothetical protein CLAFUW4_13754 [Fulvia fulva]|uniref:Uncharacterized protein n=1 Tax=Passalora fulva TaxID=5499 RepID=A0A9Q8PLN0_PASFU|nr:uncharacterized protein CLAFUR5_13601 [Fulvia fulva]KAK4610052.1 hypothetical protein CLAFUR4_13757 [Fulvia fulva]KAK4610795.1 hypothetical protein CLAFUR0_13761 [Fulvia fulva]UJO24667.1 hypothetical protein CLAFUR5_13601 [Fulvia fulva]WPV22133.1 hypothetical protein CLAFUW4_13754 [Fulvia fulva]WPV36829.1 hypothetical protein CLAFUW7_13762 [Fulvia fulva]
MPSASHADLYFDPELEGWTDHITDISITNDCQDQSMAAESAIVSRVVRQIARKHKTSSSRLHPSKFSSMAEPPHDRSSSSSSSSSSTLSPSSLANWSSMADPVQERLAKPKDWSSMADPIHDPARKASKEVRGTEVDSQRTRGKDWARERSQSQESMKSSGSSDESR